MTEFIGSRISLISNSEIRYTGILHEINSQNSTIALEQVRLYGTEGRRGDVNEVPPSDNVYDYIVFKGSDVKDLKVEQEAKKPEVPRQALDDPAIVSSSPRREPNHQIPQPPPPPFGMPPPPSYPYYPPPHLYGQQPGFPPPGAVPLHHPPPGYPSQYNPPPVQKSPPAAPLPPKPPKPSDITAPSPVQETKPDVVASTSALPPTHVPASTSKASAKPVPPALPLPAGSTINRSVPAQTKPIANFVHPPAVVPASEPSLVVNSTSSKASATTAADVQNLAKDLSETKISTVEPRQVPGAGGYLTQNRRGGGPRAPRRDFGDDSMRHQRQRRTMDADYDFYSATANFRKEDIAKEVELAVAAASGEVLSGEAGLSNGASSHAGSEKVSSPGTTSTAVLVAALAAGNEAKGYNPGKSFFDNISCESKDRKGNNVGEGPGVPVWKRGEERKLNIETFGQASVDYAPGRGPFRGGYRGGYRGGRGRGGGASFPKSSRGSSRGGKTSNGSAAPAETPS